MIPLPPCNLVEEKFFPFNSDQNFQYPVETFIPTSARVCAIIQLCLALMIILWNISLPFMGEIFAFKSQMLFYQDAMGIAKSTDSAERLARLERNKSRFELLPLEEKVQLIQRYKELQHLVQRMFFSKLGRSVHILVYEIPFYEQLWLILSIVIPIMLLKRVEGACQAVWLLPLLTCAYAFNNHRYGQPFAISNEAKLFPTENALIYDYLDEPVDPHFFKQKDQLLRAWKVYLVKEWSAHQASDHYENLSQQAEEGEFAFNIARIKSLLPPSTIIAGKIHVQREGIWILAAYLFWNLFFAVTAYRIRDSV